MKKKLLFLSILVFAVYSSYAFYGPNEILNLALIDAEELSQAEQKKQKDIADFAISLGAQYDSDEYEIAFGEAAKPAAVGGADVFKDMSNASTATADEKLEYLARENGELEGALGTVSPEAGQNFAAAANKYKKA